MNSKTTITKDLQKKQINVTRTFAAPLEKVWKAWTDSTILDKWWAPKPWKTETKTMDFKEGGLWLYSMNGPNGEKSFCRVDFETIAEDKHFASTSFFCDEDGVTDASFPSMHWFNVFTGADGQTFVNVTLTFDELADLEKIVAMGFEGGFTMGMNNLDELLAE